MSGTAEHPASTHAPKQTFEVQGVDERTRESVTATFEAASQVDAVRIARTRGIRPTQVTELRLPPITPTSAAITSWRRPLALAGVAIVLGLCGIFAWRTWETRERERAVKVRVAAAERERTEQTLTAAAALTDLLNLSTEAIENARKTGNFTLAVRAAELKTAVAEALGPPRPGDDSQLASLKASMAEPGVVLMPGFQPVVKLTMSKYRALKDGMSIMDVSKLMGGWGTEVSSTGGLATYRWENPDGSSIVATFRHTELVSKHQLGLE